MRENGRSTDGHQDRTAVRQGPGTTSRPDNWHGLAVPGGTTVPRGTVWPCHLVAGRGLFPLAILFFGIFSIPLFFLVFALVLGF